MQIKEREAVIINRFVDVLLLYIFTRSLSLSYTAQSHSVSSS